MLARINARFAGKRGFATLLWAEHAKDKVSTSNLKLLNAANKLKSDVDIVVTGSKLGPVVEQIQKNYGFAKVRKLIVADDAALAFHPADATAALLHSIISKGGDYTHVIGNTSAIAKDVLPRLAGLLDVQPLSDIVQIEDPETFIRPTYAGNAMAQVKITEKFKVFTVRASSFDAIADKPAALGKVENVSMAGVPLIANKLTLVSEQLSTATRPELTSTKIVVSGGRAVKSKEGFQLIEQLADALGAAIGASRAAVDAGYCANELQVGQTGKVVAPELYIAVGISGAIQHVAGIKDSKVIVAVNKDPDCPIFQIANYGLVGDLFKIVPELVEKLKKK